MNKILEQAASKYRKDKSLIQLSMRVDRQMQKDIRELQHKLNLRSQTDAVKCAIQAALSSINETATQNK
tara:strand:+ start:343 stop:549 length:207 start_codon:yes stop_codon:yes gene_type:complete